MLYVCFAMYVLGSVTLNFWLVRDYGETTWFRTLYVFTVPGLWAALPLMLLYGAIYATAYPDRHANELDFYGTDDAKRRLQAYRDECDARSFGRRFLEGAGILRYTGPKYPTFTDDDLIRPDDRRPESGE